MGKGGQTNVAADRLTRKITLEELSTHRKPDNAWISYNGKVYDVSNWEDHPGGTVIFTHAGDDMTDIFAAFHPKSAYDMLEKFQIGVLDESVVPSAMCKNKLKGDSQKKFEQAYRDLRTKLVAAGMFKADKVFYLRKILELVAMLALSVYIAKFDSKFAAIVGGCILGLFFQQSGWLAHDFLHHQVFEERRYNNWVGILVGDVFQGFSSAWWKSKHNTHHSVPNLLASVPGAYDGDPDIDTMPLLAWTREMAIQAKDDSFGRFMISNQKYFYFILLLFARLSWAHQSWTFVYGGIGPKSVIGAEQDRAKMPYKLQEKIGLVVHYAFFASLAFSMSISNTILYFMTGQLFCGLILALVFGLGHNGMAAYNAAERPDFWKLQVSTTRNITGGALVDWFCGGLNYQVDHHLFPSLPRHNLHQVHKLVESFCKEQGVTYHEQGLYEGTVEVLSHLEEVTVEFLTEFPAM